MLYDVALCFPIEKMLKNEDMDRKTMNVYTEAFHVKKSLLFNFSFVDFYSDRS